MTDVKQTGAERLEQARAALADGTVQQRDAAGFALDGCVLLTAEEAVHVWAFIGWEPSNETANEIAALLGVEDVHYPVGPGEGPADEHNLEMGC